MAMTDRNLLYAGNYERRWTDNRPPYQTAQASAQDMLAVSSGHGNGKDPVYFFRNKYLRHALSGTVVSTHPTNPDLDFVDTGCLRTAAAPVTDWVPPVEWLDYVYNEALQKVNGKARGDLDLAVTFGEYRQVQRMLRNTINLTRYARKISRMWSANLGRPKPRRRLQNGRLVIPKPTQSPISWRSKVRSIGDLWLEMKYGWYPFVSDIFKSASLLLEPNKEYHARAIARAEMTGTERIEREIGYGVPVVGNLEYSIRRQFIIHYKVGNTTNYDHLQQFTQFTSLNPASIAWELTPYSFVVDWLYNIGGYLRSFETALLWAGAFVNGCETLTYITEASETMRGTYRSGTHQVVADATGSWRHTYLRRQPLSGWPFPRSIHFMPKLGWQRLLSAASLLAQLLEEPAVPRGRNSPTVRR